jgi:prolipoprotein diacylglyceryltransferase
MLAVIPYETFPIIKLGPLELRTFGLMVGIGVLLGAYVAARYIEKHTGVIRDDTYRLATRMVIAGVIGARITWDITHWSDIGSPLDLIAVLWNVVTPAMRGWSTPPRLISRVEPPS